MKLHIVPARTGLAWVKLGMGTFFRQPLAMSGLFFMYLASATLLSALPFFGLFIALALVPAFTLGLMAATEEATRGKFPMPTLLLSAFRAGQQRLRHMLTLGAMYTVACLAVTLLAGVLAPMPAGGGEITPEAMRSEAFVNHYLVAMGLYLPVAALFWHAPALVHWHGISPAKSLFFSATACWRNKAAMLAYGLGWLGVFMGAGLVVTLTAALLGSPQIVGVAMFPTALFMASMFFTSIYFSFRDSFIAQDNEP